mgnify:CR=1 FL=1
MVIKIRNYTKDDTAMSYEDGQKCFKDILEVIDKEEVILDFANINYVITAFLNPIIGDLILQKGIDVMKKIGIANANEPTIKKIKRVKEGTLLKREDMQE